MFLQAVACLATVALFICSINAKGVNYSDIAGQVSAAVPACFEEAVSKMAAKASDKPQAKTKLCDATCKRPHVANPNDAPLLLAGNALYNCVQHKVYVAQGLTADDISARQVSIRVYVQNYATPIACDASSDKFCKMDPNADSILSFVLSSLGGAVNRIRIAANTDSVQMEGYVDIAYQNLEEEMAKHLDHCLEKKLDTAAGKPYAGLPEAEKKKANEKVGQSICRNWMTANPSLDGYKIWTCLEANTAPKLVDDAFAAGHPELSSDERKTMVDKFQHDYPQQLQTLRLFTSFYAPKLVCAKLGLDKPLGSVVQAKLKARLPDIQKTLDKLAVGTGKPAKKEVAF